MKQVTSIGMLRFTVIMTMHVYNTVDPQLSDPHTLVYPKLE